MTLESLPARQLEFIIVAGLAVLSFLQVFSNKLYRYRIIDDEIHIVMFPMVDLWKIDISGIRECRIVGPIFALPFLPPLLKFGTKIWSRWIFITMNSGITYGICPKNIDEFIREIESKR